MWASKIRGKLSEYYCSNLCVSRLTFLAFIVAAGLSEANRKIDGSGKQLNDLTKAQKENHILSYVQILTFSVCMCVNKWAWVQIVKLDRRPREETRVVLGKGVRTKGYT